MTTSSRTATDSTTRANRLPRMPRSAMIREMTGMLVTAMARAKTSPKENRSSAGPRKRPVSYRPRNASPARNGMTLPTTAIPRTGLRSSRERRARSSVPEQYISRSRPNW
jgi:hypothetical protein